MSLFVDAKLRRGAFRLDARFEAPLSGVTALFGPSGAGKSILLSAIAGLKRLESGRIALGPRVLDDASLHVPPHQRGVGVVFQDARLFPHLDVRGNLAFALDRTPPERRRLSLEDAAAYFDIAALLDRPTRNLSGGEKGRVALARALLAAPDLLLLDEPFAALDGARRRAFLETLRRMHKAFALPMVVVTHQIEDAAALADHLVALQDGRVVASGPFADIATVPEVQRLLDRRDIGAAVRLGEEAYWVRADHVLLASARPVGLSARHVWPAEVRSLVTEDARSVLLCLQAEIGTLYARVTAEAAAELALQVGKQVWAVVKVHAL